MFLILVCLTIDQGLNLPSKFNSFVNFSIPKNLMNHSDLCLVHFYRTIDYSYYKAATQHCNNYRLTGVTDQHLPSLFRF